MVAWWMNSQNDNILCWNFKVVLLFLSDKTSNLCNHLGPRKTTQFRSRFYADLKLLWGPNSRVTCWVSSATRLLVTSCNAANASTLRRTLRHTPLHLKATAPTPDIVFLGSNIHKFWIHSWLPIVKPNILSCKGIIANMFTLLLLLPRCREGLWIVRESLLECLAAPTFVFRKSRLAAAGALPDPRLYKGSVPTFMQSCWTHSNIPPLIKIIFAFDRK